MPLLVPTVIVTSSEAPSQYEDEVTFTATITGVAPNVPTGTCGFYDGVDLLATGIGITPISTSAGTSLFTTAGLVPGTHSITAVYSGDSNYVGLTSPAFLQQVTAVVIAANTLASFALVASYSSSGDTSLPPTALLNAIPNTAAAHQSITLVWATSNVAAVEITGNNGVDPPFDTGRLATNGSGAYVAGNGFTATIVLTMACYDRLGSPLAVSGQATITIA